jgi:hypothetical protein
MQVERSFHAPPTLQLNQLLSARARAGRVSLPVDGPFGYTRLKHIQGVPSTGSTGGFSVQRLQVIDSLIERLVSVGGSRQITEETPNFKKVAAELHKAIRGAEATGHAAGLGLTDVGTFLSMLA